ncbi:glycosyltransferase family 4 protein [Kaistella palustris]|uniref:glycosyltransferase family 4 protein n=1 Tax=Kaistella palustris TaxID=493376 RepID=UPI0003FA82C3|nr:glycosyltransferase family 4 protein [Kaistella palustris]
MGNTLRDRISNVSTTNENNMRLLYITNGINGSGGLERVLSIKASALAKQHGYAVAIVVLNDAHKNPFYIFNPKIELMTIQVGGNALSYIAKYKNGLQQAVDLFNPDVISVCDDGLKAYFIPHFIKTSAKIIYERHVSKLIGTRDDNGIIKNAVTSSKWWLMENLARKFDRYVVLTPGNRREWTTLQNMQVIANPLPFSSSRTSTQKNKIVICVGKIGYQKGQDLLVKAWSQVHSQFPDWQLHLYGKENLDFLDTNNLKENIHYFPPEKNIDQKYLESSICVMSSRFEGFGMVLVEAMEFGLPCVSFACDYGPSDIIVDGVDGFLVQKEDVTALSKQLTVLLGDEDLRVKMGKKAKENVQRFAPAEIVNNWDRLFRELCRL